MSIILRKRKLKSGKESFVLDININNRRWTENLKGLELVPELEISESATAKERKQIEKQNKEIRKLNLEAEQTAENCLTLRNSELILSANGLQPKARTVYFLNQYQAFLHTKSNSATYKAYEQTLSTFTAFIGKSKIKELTTKDINKALLQSFLKFLLNRKVSAEKRVSTNSIRLYFSRLKHFFNYLIKEKIVSENPINEITLPKYSANQREYLTIEEIQLLAKNGDRINKTAKDMFLLACFTGLRVSDLIRLKWTDIKDGDRIQFRVTKTGKLQTLKLSNPAKQILEQIERTGEKVFKTYNESTIRHAIIKWSKQSGIEKTVSIHTARHSFAVNYLSAGGDIYILSKLLGHSNLLVTQVYSDIISRRLDEAMQLFDNVKIKQFIH